MDRQSRAQLRASRPPALRGCSLVFEWLALSGPPLSFLLQDVMSAFERANALCASAAYWPGSKGRDQITVFSRTPERRLQVEASRDET